MRLPTAGEQDHEDSRLSLSGQIRSPAFLSVGYLKIKLRTFLFLDLKDFTLSGFMSHYAHEISSGARLKFGLPSSLSSHLGTEAWSLVAC